MNKRFIFIGTSLFLLVLILVLFLMSGNKKEKLPENTVVVSVKEEAEFVADVQTLDSLYHQLQTAVYSKNVSAMAEVNVQWEKHKNGFLAQYKNNILLAQLADQVLHNYRERVKMVKETYRVKLKSLDQAESLKTAIKEEESKMEELKVDNQTIKAALLNQQ